MDIYIQINHKRLINKPDKVLFTTMYLTGLVFSQFKPFIRDYQIYNTDKQDDKTKVMFTSYAEFKK